MAATPSTKLDPVTRQAVLGTAAAAIESGLGRSIASPPDARHLPQPLAEHRASFVTLTLDRALRGCCGTLEPARPLLLDVWHNAQASAFHDPRFPPLRASELPEIRLELSVLSEPRSVTGVEEIQVGRHGLIVRRGPRSGLLLPQVATEYGWDRDTFLSHTCLKAGLPENSWREPGTEIEIFGAEVFGEGRE